MNLKKLTVTYEELFEILNFDNTKFYDSQFYNNNNIFVETPSGYTPVIGGCVKNDLNMLHIEFDNNTSCNVAEEHIFSCNGDEIFAKNAEIVDTKSGSINISKKTKIGKHDGFDINIKAPHWYYSTNDVIYHNTLLMNDLFSGMLKDNKNILVVSLEMSDKEIMKRVHANVLDLPINSLIDLAKTEGELREIIDRKVISKEEVIAAYNNAKLSGKCGKLFVKDYPAGSFSALQLESLVETYKIEKGVIFDIIFVDYLGIMKSDLISPSAGLYSYLKSIGEEVRSTASKLNVPIVSASQLNRGVLGKDSKDVDNSSISDSMGTAMTADLMIFLLQDEEMKERKEIILKCTKNRYTGRTDTWMMNIDYEHMRFADVITENSVEHLAHIASMEANNTPDNALDFGIVTSDKMKSANEFATQEVKDIITSDFEKIKEADKNIADPFKNSTDDLFRELGLL